MTEVVVTAPARLHFGMLDPAGIGERRFGGFGVGVDAPRVVVGLRRRADSEVVASGPQAERAVTYARRARAVFGLAHGVEVRVYNAIPAHNGLGSGTKLGLAVARGLAELAGILASPPQLAAACGRGARSSVGAWTFAEPGLVVEAGVLDDGQLSPLVARHPMPAAWRCVLALPAGADGLSGVAEERFFERMRAAPAAEPGVSRLLLSELLPGLLAADLERFGAALHRIQCEVGAMFAPQQGGVFHPRATPLVDALLSLGVGAVGQSSWGPAVYGIVASAAAANEAAERMRVLAGDGADVMVVDFDRRGAQVSHSSRAAA